jgi:hypothetical protein
MLISHSVHNSGYLGSRSLLVGAIAILGVLSGYCPGLSAGSSLFSSPQLLFNAPAQAQAVFSDEELRTYVRAAFEIEMARRQTYSNISDANSGSVPEISCNNLDNLAGNVAGMARGFCNQSATILSQYGISPERFNQIYSSRISDANLDARIRQIVRELLPRRSR